MTRRRLPYSEHVAFYQRQQLYRKRRQFGLLAFEEPAAVAAKSTAPAPQAPMGTRRIPLAPPIDPTVRLRLRVAAGPDVGVDFPLREGEHIIGRDDDADVKLTDGTVSGHHARVLVTQQQATIEDLKSLNGTTINSTRLRGIAIMTLGAHIFVGSTELVVMPGDQQ